MGDVYGGLASASEYGGYGAADGYGYEKTVDCNSALGLIGLLGLIELLRDVIERVIMPMRRRKRSVEDDGGSSNYLLGGFFSPGGPATSLLHTLPVALMPLLHSAVDVNDGLVGSECLEVSVCEANRALVTAAGTDKQEEEEGGGGGGGRGEGRTDGTGESATPDSPLTHLVSTLLSQVVAGAFTHDQESYSRALRAAQKGRQGTGADCLRAFPNCSAPGMRNSQYLPPVGGINVTSLIREHLRRAT